MVFLSSQCFVDKITLVKQNFNKTFNYKSTIIDFLADKMYSVLKKTWVNQVCRKSDKNTAGGLWTHTRASVCVRARIDYLNVVLGAIVRVRNPADCVVPWVQMWLALWSIYDEHGWKLQSSPLPKL